MGFDVVTYSGSFNLAGQDLITRALPRTDILASFVGGSGAVENCGSRAMQIESDQDVDACGLTCPLPLLKAKQALNKLQAGQVLSVVCTDSGSVKDFQVFSERSGHQLLDSREDAGKYYYWLKKS